MNKLEANISLFIITCFAAVQYIFLSYIPEGVSNFAFISITNFIGFIMVLAFFFGELFRMDMHQILQSLVLSSELIIFNFFTLLGASEMPPEITAAVLSSYFVIVVMISILFFGTAARKSSFIGIAFVLAGLFMMMDADIISLWNIHMLYLLIADIAFAVYIMTVGFFSGSSNPSILSLGQMFFCFILSLIFWAGEVFFNHVPFRLPVSKEFWGSVIYISFFIRGLYTVIQIYAQRYVSPLNTSLIFSTEIIITMILSPLLALFFGTKADTITLMKISGSAVMFFGLMITEPKFADILRKFLHV